MAYSCRRMQNLPGGVGINCWKGFRLAASNSPSWSCFNVPMSMVSASSDTRIGFHSPTDNHEAPLILFFLSTDDTELRLFCFACLAEFFSHAEAQSSQRQVAMPLPPSGWKHSAQPLTLPLFIEGVRRSREGVTSVARIRLIGWHIRWCRGRGLLPLLFLRVNGIECHIGAVVENHCSAPPFLWQYSLMSLIIDWNDWVCT